MQKMLHNRRFPRSNEHDPDLEEVKLALGRNPNDDEAPALEADRGRYLGFVRMVARRRKDAGA